MPSVNVWLSIVAFILPVTYASVRHVRSVSFQPQNSENSLRILTNASPLVDFPIYSKIPETTFTCQGVQPDTYKADEATGCQVFHFCHNATALTGSYLCPNYTIFNDENQVCEWFYNVDCSQRFTGIIVHKSSVPAIVPVVPIATISNASWSQINEIQTSQSNPASIKSRSTACEQCAKEKVGLVIPVVQETPQKVVQFPVLRPVEKVVAVVKTSQQPMAQIMQPGVSFHDTIHEVPTKVVQVPAVQNVAIVPVVRGQPESTNQILQPGVSYHVGESKNIHVSQSMNPVYAVIAEPKTKHEESATVQTQYVPPPPPATTTERPLFAIAITSRPNFKPETTTVELPVKPTPIPVATIDSQSHAQSSSSQSAYRIPQATIHSSEFNKVSSNTTGSQTSPSTASSQSTQNTASSSNLGSGITSMQPRSGWGAAAPVLPSPPTTGWGSGSSPMTGYGAGANFASHGLTAPSVGMGAVQALHPAQQIQLYSMGAANPFMVDPFFTPIRMYSGSILAMAQPTLGMLNMFG